MKKLLTQKERNQQKRSKELLKRIEDRMNRKNALETKVD
jgi:hypothetical protein